MFVNCFFQSAKATPPAAKTAKAADDDTGDKSTARYELHEAVVAHDSGARGTNNHMTAKVKDVRLYQSID